MTRSVPTLRKYLPVCPMKLARLWSYASWVATDEALVKKTFVSPFLKHRREGKGQEKKLQERLLQSFLRYTQTQ